MKIIGIIAEYNPFHNGHIYQIKKIKETYPDSLIITIISSSFSQRGEVLLLDKWERAKVLLESNVDLVIELPYPFSVQSADTFAYGSIKILNNLKIDMLSFGIETNIEDIRKAAEIQINNKNFDLKVKEYSNKKYNYRASISKAIKDLTGISILKPNDILAVSYLKEIIKNNKSIDVLPIKRTNDYLDIKSNSNIISASNIRNKLYNKNNIKKYVPKNVYKYLKSINYDENKYFDLLKYKLLSENDIKRFVTVDEGIDSRIKSSINSSNNLEELVEKIQTKRYTPNKIRRTLCHILNGFTKEDKNKFIDPTYIRILGFNDKGKKHLNSIKKNSTLPIITNYKKGFDMLEFEIKISSIYDILMNKNTRDNEYKKGPIIY